MKNRIVIVLICFVLMFSVVSCDDQEKSVGYGSLSVEISNSENSKTIQPTSESLAFTSYTIKGRYGSNKEWIVNESFSSKTIKIDHLEVGDWEFVVEGFNTDGVLLAKSEPHNVTIKAGGIEKEIYALYWIEGGYGSLKLSVKVQTSRASTIECRMYEGDAETVFEMTKEDSILEDDGLYLFERCFENVSEGVYKAEITMRDDKNEQIGKTLHQSVHIYDGLESSFSFTWNGFPNLLPQVDVPKPNFDDGVSISCDSTILLDTEEKNTNVFYSFDGESYSNYREDGIDLAKIKGISTSLTIWIYAEKRYMDRSDVEVFSYVIQHPDERVHIEAKDPACSEVGWSAYDKCSKCLYSQNYNEIPALGHDKIHYKAMTPTCTRIGWDEYYTCTRCDYTTYKEIPALGHALKPCTRVDDEYHEGICSRCSKTIKDFHSFEDYKCTACGTWGRGPSGGYVFYDRGEYTGGERSWRYLEAAPADLRLVNGVSTVDSTMDGYSNGTNWLSFGDYRETSDEGPVFLGTKEGIGKGYNNTKILVDKMRDAAYTRSSGTGTTAEYAARLCDILVHEVNGEVFDDWFLPSEYELNLMYENLYRKGLSSFANNGYWSSSERSADYAWRQHIGSGNGYITSGNRTDVNRYNSYCVRPVRAF